MGSATSSTESPGVNVHVVALAIKVIPAVLAVAPQVVKSKEPATAVIRYSTDSVRVPVVNAVAISDDEAAPKLAACDAVANKVAKIHVAR